MKDYELNCEQLFISNEQLKEVGFSQYKINNLVNDGFIEKINRKYYENLHYDGMMVRILISIMSIHIFLVV